MLLNLVYDTDNLRLTSVQFLGIFKFNKTAPGIFFFSPYNEINEQCIPIMI